MSQGIESLADLIRDEGDGREFFTRNYVTHGMAQLSVRPVLRMLRASPTRRFSS